MGNLFLIVVCQLMNVERIMEIERYNLATTVIGGRFRQESYMDTQPVHGGLMRNKILAWSQSIVPQNTYQLQKEKWCRNSRETWLIQT